ncbi:sulfite exporter TauE/SafE family protein [Alicyclobacillus fastidiosus]|uniref:Probable membrane transporter protein n=1 Tax=Alicyclobacillus fastidiosus TaxID=392011 RepID=A0ABY6ZMI9_9BACL|nr:sulfite exporter TauE/SafE family protein [Alicyclobacillus fastidiosus]WAH44052.1 sulfite exporter TauE/SafE family protein [Alicyclobacillus fastidiosus]GMA60339.1 anion permease [Alicyclobacillus fastidiosus]
MPHLSGIQMTLALLSGGIVGFILGLIGGGGSILAVPLMLYLVGFHDPHVVIGSTAFAVAVNAFLNLIPHWRAGNVRWKSAIAFALPGAVGAYVGSVFGKMVNDKVILFLFAILMIVIAILMLRPKKQSTAASEEQGKSKLTRVIPTGLSTGLVSGFFGIGGGFLIVPGLVFSAGLTMAEAIGTSLFSVGAFGVTTAVSYAVSGLVDWLVVALYIVGGVVGGVAGVRACTAIGRNVRRLQIIFSSIIILVALYMLYMNLEAIKAFHW